MDGLAYLYRRMIAEYWFEIEENPQSFDECDEYLDGRIKAIPKGKSFIFVADPHCFMAHKRPLEKINARNSVAIIGYVRAMTGIRKVIMGGDVLERGANRYLGLQELLIYNNEMVAMAGGDYIVVHGNHDQNTPNIPLDKESVDRFMIPYSEMEKRMYSHLERVCEDEGRILERLSAANATCEQKREYLAYSRFHFYIDDNDAKIRYIIVDTGTPGQGRNGVVEELFGVYNNGELILQYDWLYEVLMSVPKGYDVVVAGHALLNYGGRTDIAGVSLNVCKLLSGYRTRSKVTVNNPYGDNERLFRYYAKGAHEYDFSAAVGNSTVVVMAADVHSDAQTVADYDGDGNFVSKPYMGGILPETAIVVNSVQTDAWWGVSRKFPEKSCPMVVGTRSEQCFDVVTICEDGEVRFTRIGAGQDRGIRNSAMFA